MPTGRTFLKNQPTSKLFSCLRTYNKMHNYLQLLHHLSFTSSALMLSGLLCLVVSLFVFYLNRPQRQIYFSLGLSVFLFSLGIALIDPFLNQWDEQFHALVAKNLSRNPLKPMLIESSPAPLNYQNWTYNHIWLHKQPLFLWQMALSIKLFGTNLLAVRLPSVLMHVFSTLICYSIGKRFLSPYFAFLAAILVGFSDYFNDFVSGASGMDHNDVAFTFYVLASLWTWFKLQENPSDKKWIIALGLFSGGAILCKWLVGLIVFAGWGATFVFLKNFSKDEWLKMGKAILVCCAIVLPWQLYCAVSFPKEYFYEMSFNAKHFTEVIENHGGNYLFYWDVLKESHGKGDLNRWLILIGLLLLFRKSLRKERYAIFGLTVFSVIFAFFTLAATKLPGYINVIAVVGFIALLLPVQEFIQLIRNKVHLPKIHWLLIPLSLFVLFLHFSPKSLMDRHKFSDLDLRNKRIEEIQHAQQQLANAPDSLEFVEIIDTSFILPHVQFFTNRKVIRSTGY